MGEVGTEAAMLKGGHWKLHEPHMETGPLKSLLLSLYAANDMAIKRMMARICLDKTTLDGEHSSSFTEAKVRETIENESDEALRQRCWRNRPW